MARVKGAMMTRKRRNKMLGLAKGYWGSKSRHFKMAKEQVMKSGRYAYAGRKQKKRDFRQLWITRISAACKMNGMNYSTFMHGLKLAGIDMNRKMLSETAIHDPAAFTALCEKAKAAKKNFTRGTGSSPSIKNIWASGCPYILRAARRRGCASKAQDKVSPGRQSPPGDFGRPMRAAIPILAAFLPLTAQAFLMCPILRGKMGLKYAARAGGRGRARWAGGRSPPTGVGCVVGDIVLVAALLGAPPPCPPQLCSCQRRERKRSNARSAMRRAIRRRDDHRDTRKPVKDSIYLRNAPKRFSFGV